jgi:APA family basic amino acid/polyamine antiporter
LRYSLPKVTWFRFGIWMAAGLAIYFAYSVRHSKLQKTA